MARSIIADGTRIHPHEFSDKLNLPCQRNCRYIFLAKALHSMSGTIHYFQLSPVYISSIFWFWLNGGELRSLDSVSSMKHEQYVSLLDARYMSRRTRQVHELIRTFLFLYRFLHIRAYMFFFFFFCVYVPLERRRNFHLSFLIAQYPLSFFYLELNDIYLLKQSTSFGLGRNCLLERLHVSE